MLETIPYEAGRLGEDDAVEIGFPILRKIGRSEGDKGHTGWALKCQRHDGNIRKQDQRKTQVKMSEI